MEKIFIETTEKRFTENFKRASRDKGIFRILLTIIYAIYITASILILGKINVFTAIIYIVCIVFSLMNRIEIGDASLFFSKDKDNFVITRASKEPNKKYDVYLVCQKNISYLYLDHTFVLKINKGLERCYKNDKYKEKKLDGFISFIMEENVSNEIVQKCEIAKMNSEDEAVVKKSFSGKYSSKIL